MSTVTLVSGGLDSTLMAALCAEEGIVQHPVFVDYGQRSAIRELAACQANLERLGLAAPLVANVRGYGDVARSGLTTADLDVFVDAFTPGRNLLFLTVGAAYAVRMGAESVAIGLLDERSALFPDQTSGFLAAAETTLSIALGRAVRVLSPLSGCSKSDIIAMAARRGISSTYSCHLGEAQPCGRCVACREFNV